MNTFLKRIGLEPFVLLLFVAIFLAWLNPVVGSGKGPCSLTAISHYGISVIFFFYGLRLNWAKIKSGLANVKLHGVVLCTTFLFFPLFVLLVMQICGHCPSREDMELLTGGVGADGARTLLIGLWLGVFFLSTLPSTVSSSVVMVNIAKGNVPAAIFDASISSLLGVFITPLWMRLFVSAGTGGNELNQVIFSLVLQVIVPIMLGIALHRSLGWFSQKYDSMLRKFDESVILLIVYTSFCHSFFEEMFEALSWTLILYLSVGMIALFFSSWTFVASLCRLLRFNREDRITALFCGSKKSLVHGTVMSLVILQDPKLAGILILPTMIYHALQLIIVGIIAHQMLKSAQQNPRRSA
ncbi:MAG: bile acid:sodium symporter [Thermoguttaceae bacterium]|nr:bile acid:sodium symporter [Thermoguttaceae bacterium]